MVEAVPSLGPIVSTAGSPAKNLSPEGFKSEATARTRTAAIPQRGWLRFRSLARPRDESPQLGAISNLDITAEDTMVVPAARTTPQRRFNRRDEVR